MRNVREKIATVADIIWTAGMYGQSGMFIQLEPLLLPKTNNHAMAKSANIKSRGQMLGFQMVDHPLLSVGNLVD